MATQTKNGKAFEYAILKEFQEKLQRITSVEVIVNSALDTAKKHFDSFDKSEQGEFLLYASFSVNFLIDIEPRLSNNLNENDVLQLEILTDDRGQDGDVRDVVIIRLAQEWEIGISAKNNHKAVKHSRLSNKIDFGEKWLGVKASQEYFDAIKPIFDSLEQMRKESNKTKTWKSLGDYHPTIYTPILEAFKTELLKIYNTNPSKVASTLVEYLIGNRDFYKVIKSKKNIEIQAYNLHGTLNLPFKDVNPKFNTPQVALPTEIINISYKKGTLTTLIVELNNDWTLSFRIHNASSRIEPSLKFDINLLKAPNTLFTNKLSIGDKKKINITVPATAKTNIISLFSGAGGLDLGFEKAGFKTIWANEYDKDIWETFEKNFIETTLDRRSIVNVPSDEIPETLGLIGGPPCQSWSEGGKSRGIEDARGQLFFEFIRVLRDKKPLFFLAENVSGMLASRHSEALENIKKHFTDSGYKLSSQLLNAHDYGVPQDRKRVFFIGFREDLNIEFKFPKPLENKLFLEDVIDDLKDSALPAQNKTYSNGDTCEVFNHEYMTGGFSSMYMSRNRVRNWSEPSFTIQAGGRHAPLHPQAPEMELVEKDKRKFVEGKEELYRRLTIRECARIQTFPDSHKFYYKNLTAGYKMVGNAVPPSLAYVLAESIMEQLKEISILESLKKVS